MIRTMNLITPANGGATVVLPPEGRAEFDRVEPYGYKQDVAKCIQVNGRWYPLREGTPEAGLDTWDSNEVEARELAFDAYVAAMPETMRERFNVTAHKPYVERKAQREYDDAEAEVRGARTQQERNAAKAKRDEKKASLDAIKGARP